MNPVLTLIGWSPGSVPWIKELSGFSFPGKHKSIKLKSEIISSRTPDHHDFVYQSSLKYQIFGGKANSGQFCFKYKMNMNKNN